MSASLEAAIVEMLRSKGDGVSMVELSRIPEFTGDMVLFGEPGCVIWTRCTQEAITALRRLMDSQQVLIRQTQPLVYLVDGGTIDLPLAKRLRPYKHPHWLPVALSRGPRFPAQA